MDTKIYAQIIFLLLKTAQILRIDEGTEDKLDKLGVQLRGGSLGTASGSARFSEAAPRLIGARRRLRLSPARFALPQTHLPTPMSLCGVMCDTTPVLQAQCSLVYDSLLDSERF